MTHLNMPSIGVCSWSVAPQNIDDLITQLDKINIKHVQLALLPLFQEPNLWQDAKAKLAGAGITLASGMFGTIGEDYSTLASIAATGGFILDEHWDQNWENIKQVVQMAQHMGITDIAGHAGFLPDDTANPAYQTLQDRLGQVADLFQQHNLNLIFETGQETADTLNHFLDDLGRDNVGINFDPANLILYAKGDPVTSLKKLLPRVKQCHLKDAVKTTLPGTWGKEVPLGQGQVDWPGFIKALIDAQFQGHLVIEREAGETRLQDIQTAQQVIGRLLSSG